MERFDYRRDTPLKEAEYSLPRTLARTKYLPRPERMAEIARQYRCRVALDNRNVIWIHRDGQWQVFEWPWWEGMR